MHLDLIKQSRANTLLPLGVEAFENKLHLSEMQCKSNRENPITAIK